MSRLVACNRFHLFAALTAVHLTLIIGCGVPDPTDAEEVNFAIANLSDAAVDPESFQSFFVDGSAPDESKRRRYREYFYEVDTPQISGNSATAVVRIMNSAGEVLDEKEWTFTKVGTQWKMSAAPLP